MKELLIFWDTNLAGKHSKPKGSGVLSSGSIRPQLVILRKLKCSNLRGATEFPWETAR